MWVRVCFWRSPDVLKDLQQFSSWHLYGFSPVCVREWLFSPYPKMTKNHNYSNIWPHVLFKIIWSHITSDLWQTSSRSQESHRCTVCLQCGNAHEPVRKVIVQNMLTKLRMSTLAPWGHPCRPWGGGRWCTASHSPHIHSGKTSRRHSCCVIACCLDLVIQSEKK